ncbi:DNA primase [Sediminibacterium sp.]|uniref:DNA primase n=1 Tax=Sediminibacterium sp. TaxID=1917865 RepID=UPI003F69B2B5
MISEQTKQQITSRIDIIDVIGEFVKLKKRGTNYLGLCPFHGEKSPSFTVSPVKEIYKCFGCGKSGNTITFLMEHEKYSYVEALKWLAHRYNVEIEETQRTPEQVQQQQVSESLHAINTFAQKFFTEQLFHSEEGQMIAGSYLKERGFREEVLQKFQIGYNPSAKDALTAALLQNQFNKDLLPKTGLVAFRNEELVDNYRGRIIFPIHNNTGKIIGFGARVIGKADKAPKYINTPENEVYSKSKILYGSYFARQAIDKAKECLLVEGYTDVVSLHQAGIENVVASGGTSLTIDQLRLIKKYTNNLTIIYDGDAAGIKAALRGLDLAVEEGLDVKLVLIPDGEDPDSYVNKVGATAFNAFIAASKKDFILFQLEVLLKEAGNDINKKSGIVNQIAETLSKISRAEDFTRQQDYIKQCASLLKIDEAGFTNLVNKFKRDKIAKEEKKLPFEEADFMHQDSLQPNSEIDEGQLLLQQDDQVEKNVVRVLYEYGLKPYDEARTIAAYIFEELENYPIENPTYEKLIDLYKDAYNKGLEPTTKSMLYHDDASIREMLINISMFPFELSNRWDEILPNMNIVNKDVSIPDTEMSLNYFKLRKIKKMFEQNQRDMETASFEEQLKLIELHKQLKEFEIAITKQLGTVILR